jgi:hypothetical protein
MIKSLALRVIAVQSAGLRVLLGRRRKQEHGQALPLASIGIFIMCIGVLATVNLGQAVHEKIKLQNTADSAAYTLAAMEARTFNYIAFLNRTQIAHYNTAMAVQSVMTWVGFHMSVVAAGTDMAKSLEQSLQFGADTFVPCSSGGNRCLYVAALGVVSPMVRALEQSRRSLMTMYDNWHDQGHQMVQALAIFNKDVVFNAQVARAALMNVNIMSGMQNYIEKLDDDISFFNGNSALLNTVVNAAMNSIEYYYAFDRSAGINPQALFAIQDYMRLKRDDVRHKGFLKRQSSRQQSGNTEHTRENAYRVMTEMINASRTPSFVSGGQDSGRNQPATFESSSPNLLVLATKGGSTKMTSSADIRDSQVSSIRSDDTASSGRKNYTIGTHISSDDYARRAAGAAWNTNLAVVAWSSRQGALGDAISSYDAVEHQMYRGSRSAPRWRSVSARGRLGMSPGFPGRTHGPESVSCGGDTTHQWPGLAPFFKFAVNSERTSDYGQPSTWIFLNKHHRDFQTPDGSHSSGRSPHYGNWTIQIGNQRASLDTTIGGSRNSFLFEGINVVSRGMAYYHRPGRWAEQPNFFNPFWRARLAPIGQKLQNFWDKYVSRSITTSSDDRATQMLVNALRNAQMDMFTSAITSLVTH